MAPQIVFEPNWTRYGKAAPLVQRSDTRAARGKPAAQVGSETTECKGR